MSLQYKENNFSTENFSTSQTVAHDKTTRPNIDSLIKRILVEKRRERNNTIALGFFCLSVVLIFINLVD